ncbi:MAG TPA: hypothetical protein VF702_14765 [Allosphingosinicella sp.]|jgi:hypothetical protein
MHRLAFLLVSAFALAAPASAQIAGKHDYGDVRMPDRLGPDGRLPRPSPGAEVRDIRGRVDDARDAGAISRREARQLDRQARAIGGLARRYGRDGLSAPEAREIEARSLALRAELAAAQLSRDDRPRRRGRR